MGNFMARIDYSLGNSFQAATSRVESATNVVWVPDSVWGVSMPAVPGWLFAVVGGLIGGTLMAGMGFLSVEWAALAALLLAAGCAISCLVAIVRALRNDLEGSIHSLEDAIASARRDLKKPASVEDASRTESENQ